MVLNVTTEIKIFCFLVSRGSNLHKCLCFLNIQNSNKKSVESLSCSVVVDFFCFLFYFIFKLYIIVLVLPNIKMNPPQVYMCSPSWTLLPPPSPYHPSGWSQCTSPKHPVLCIESGLATRSYMIFYMFQCHSPKSFHPLPLPQSP